jgi:hypothetical protein
VLLDQRWPVCRRGVEGMQQGFLDPVKLLVWKWVVSGDSIEGI